MRFRDLTVRGGAMIVLFAALSAGSASAAKNGAAEFRNGRQNFENTIRLLKEKYYRTDLSDDEIYEAATRGLLENIQPETTWDKLLTKAEYDELMRSLEGKISGIGVVLSYSEKSGTADVVKVLAGTPAAKAGVQSGDRILKVDGKTFKNEPFAAMVEAIRGQAGKPVALSLLRDSSIIEAKVTRSNVTWDTATAEVIGGVGVLTIRAFSNQTPEQTKKALEHFTKEGVSGLVVDLRDNSGGSLESALQVMDLLTPKGTALARISQRGGKTEVRAAKEEGLFTRAETAVLMNNETACGAELLAAILKRTRQATFIGEKTTGKWSVQRVEAIANGFAVKYTTALLAPGDGSGNETGPANTEALVPDVEVKLAEGESAELVSRIENPEERLAKDAQLRAAIEVVN